MTRTPTSIDLLIGFTAGQIQLMDPLQHECRKCFNDEVGTSFLQAHLSSIDLITLFRKTSKILENLEIIC